MGNPVILIVTAMQPERGGFSSGSSSEERRIDGLMRGAGFAQPAAIEIDGADEATRPHARISDRQYAAARYAADGDAPEIDGCVYVSSERPLKAGDLVRARVTDADEYDLWAETV